MKWLSIVKPTSPFVATCSLFIMIGSGIFWLIIKRLSPTGDWVDTTNEIGIWLFWVSFSFSIIIFIFYIPYKINKEDKEHYNKQIEQLKPLIISRDTHLLDLQNRNNSYISIKTKRGCIWNSIKTSIKYAEVEFYVINGNIFDVDVDYQFKESTMNIENEQDVSVGVPNISNKGGDILGAASIADLTIRQPLTEPLFALLDNARKAKFVIWKFHFILKVNGKDFSGDVEWVDTHDSIRERD